ncbi:MAG: hypothetical protein ACOYI6_04035 [Christensenellales bacterium]|jgi:hypothetical protein
MKNKPAIINLHTGQPVTREELDASRRCTPEPARPVQDDARELTLAALAARVDYQERKRQPSQNMHGVHVGDLFYVSWGYEQTNVDFWQVVELKGKQTAIIRQIYSELVEATGYMTGTVRPVRDAWRNERLYTVRTQADKYRDGNTVTMRAPDLHGHTLHPVTDDCELSYSSYH